MAPVSRRQTQPPAPPTNRCRNDSPSSAAIQTHKYRLPRFSALPGTRTGTSPIQTFCTPPARIYSLPRSLFFFPRRLLFPDPCHAYSCLISYFSSPVDRSSFLLYPQRNIPFFFPAPLSSFSSFRYPLVPPRRLCFYIGAFISLARACDTRLIPPFVWHSKRTTNVTPVDPYDSRPQAGTYGEPSQNSPSLSAESRPGLRRRIEKLKEGGN